MGGLNIHFVSRGFDKVRKKQGYCDVEYPSCIWDISKYLSI